MCSVSFGGAGDVFVSGRCMTGNEWGEEVR